MTARLNRREHGGALLVSLVFLIVIALMGLTSLQTGRLELRMSGNDESRASALEAARALGDAVTANPDMTPVFGGLGTTLCTPGEADCDSESIYMPEGDLAPEVDAGHLRGRAVLNVENAPPPRGLGFSADKFSASQFRVSTRFNRADEGLGRADVTHGLVVLTPQN